MKKAHPVRLSLRKLMLAMLAVGPVAVLPSPVFAALPTYNPATPTTGSFVVTNGSVVATSGTGVIQASDRAVLVWGTGNFNIASGETYNFATSGSVLNKVGYNTNGTLGTADNAVINGTLLSSGRVFVLANGQINVGAGANITTTQGAIFSTLQETTDFPFTTGGNLGFTGAPLGSVNLGNASSGGALVNVAGNLSIWAGAISTNNVTVSGDLVLNQVTANSGILLTGSGGATTVNGNLTVTTNNGTIGQGTGTLSAPTGTTSLTTNGNVAISLTNAANNFTTLRVNAGTGTGGNVAVTDINSIDLGASRAGENLTVTAGGNINTTGAVVVTGTTLLTASAGSVTFGNGSSTGTFSASAPAGVTFNGVGNVITTGLTSSAGNVAISTNGTVTLGGTISASGNNVTVTANNVSANATGSIGATANVVTINSTAGGIVLPSITANTLVLATANNSVSQATGTILTVGNGTVTGNLTANLGTGNISLTNANALRAVTTLTGNSASLTSSQNLVIGQTNLTGSLTINTAITTAVTANAATVVIGTGSGTAATGLSVGGNLAITTNNSAISDDSFVAQTVLGSVTINTVAGVGATGAPVTLNAAANSPDGDRTQFGQFNVNTGNATVILSETTTMNLGNITGGALTFRTQASGSDILINGQITGASATFNANPAAGNITQSASGNIGLTGASTYNVGGNGSTNLSTATNSFGGTVTLVNGINDIVVSGGNIAFVTNNVTGGNVLVQTVGATANTVTFAATGTSNAANVTINSAGPIIIGGSTMSVARLTLITTDSSATSITQGGAFNQMNNTLTLTTAGNVVLSTVTNNITGNVVLNNVAGDTTINSARNLTVSGSSTGNLNAQAGTAVAGASTNTFSGPWNLILGNLNVRGLNAAANNGNTTIVPSVLGIVGNPAGGNASAGNSGDIRQLANTSVHVENDANFVVFNGTVNLVNNGNSFGRISAYTGGGLNVNGAGRINIVEDSTLKVGNLLAGTAAGASANLTSRFGSIIEDPVANNALSIVSLALNAPAGSILLGNQDHTNATTTTAALIGVTANAAGAVKLISSGNLTLGAINANSLVATSGEAISQNGRLNIFGTASFFSTGGTGSIILSDATNNFGPVSVSTTVLNAPITITEGGTLNLRSATLPGGGNSAATFTATSVNGDIIDTGLGGFKPGGTTASPGSGLVTLSAVNGNITIDDPTSDFQTTGGVLFNAKNVTLAVLGGNTTNPVTLTLGSAGATSVAGNLTVTSIIGDIIQVGALNVTGNATFQTGTRNISLPNSSNVFGALKFVGNQVSIAQSGDMKILTGSSATGQASLAANNGGITIIADPSAAIVTFGNIVNLSATGNIILPKLLQAVGTISLSTPATANLGALSITQDLGGKTPNATQVLGTYVPPQP